MEKEYRKYFVLIKLGNSTPILQRVRESAKAIQLAIEKVSNNDCQLVFTSSSGDCFGYLLKTIVPSGVIKAELDGRTASSDTSALRSDDSVLVLEVGEDFTGTGFSRGWTWLQHR